MRKLHLYTCKKKAEAPITTTPLEQQQSAEYRPTRGLLILDLKITIRLRAEVALVKVVHAYETVLSS